MSLVSIGFALLLCASTTSCGSDQGPDSSMDVSAAVDVDEELSGLLDIIAHEVTESEPIDSDFCVGQERLPQFAEYDYQCAKVQGQGLCIQMPNPGAGNAYYCALCGLKGEKMLCYMINPE